MAKRLCCQHLAHCAQNLKALHNAANAGQLFDILQKECILIQQSGADRVQFDAKTQTCYLHIAPDAETIITEAGITLAAEDRGRYALVAKLNKILANKAQSQQIDQHGMELADKLRAKEAKFGPVLAETKPKDRTSPSNEAQNNLQSHPLLAKTQQLDGISDRRAQASPAENPEAQQKAQELQYQPRPGVDLKAGQKFNPRPQMP